MKNFKSLDKASLAVEVVEWKAKALGGQVNDLKCEVGTKLVAILNAIRAAEAH